MPDYYSMLQNIYGQGPGNISDPYLSQAYQWAQGQGLGEVASLAQALQQAEAQREAERGRLGREFGFQTGEVERTSNEALRGALSRLANQGLYQSGITGMRTGEIMSGAERAKALMAAEQAAALGGLSQQGSMEWQNAMNQISALRGGQRSWAEQMAENLRNAAFGREATEAELTGMWRGNPTLSKQSLQQAIEDAAFQRRVSEAGLTGLWNGQPTIGGLGQQAQLTGSYTPPAGYPAPTMPSGFNLFGTSPAPAAPTLSSTILGGTRAPSNVGSNFNVSVGGSYGSMAAAQPTISKLSSSTGYKWYYDPASKRIMTTATPSSYAQIQKTSPYAVYR